MSYPLRNSTLSYVNSAAPSAAPSATASKCDVLMGAEVSKQVRSRLQIYLRSNSEVVDDRADSLAKQSMEEEVNLEFLSDSDDEHVVGTHYYVHHRA